MKNTAIAALVISSLGLAACQKEEAVQKAPEVKLETTSQQQAYGLGASLGQFIDQKLDMQESVEVNLDRQLVIQGFIDTLTAESKLNQQQIQEVLTALDGEVKEKQQNKEAQVSEANLAAGQAFLEENAKREGVTVTESGLQYEVVQQGDGPKPSAEDTVKVHYTGTLLDGTKFDSSYDRNEPAVFPLHRVIAGWTEGVQLMNVGSKFKFYIPADLAYGKRSTGLITANSTLVFDVELLGIESTNK
ncbi:FKBP-type peptidyl-prolyl cis-trans isomerase [Aliiglaciecola sp. CAU 1673]|uniref:FKBP-type peptidyl-prolyl cis-trans isomerase n=1 Tax=Aliiglaciecola sp. CAU 1673 TaxID=3032595 RepID=UPI0023DB69DD|nr:FKBP-type peptidyl-prolyl cis-trans isomerase [Aliiglaciecola sp. CAU 1673]MDF2179239.1 FKBP-type peptidyl-prolyl cis-trans isomerase [Aliiglaciecola sp. CAU 1673]